MVGQGSEKEKVYNKACDYKLNDDIMFLGVRNDISEIMQASDIFVFPSFYEGLGIVTIEAQAVGLPTICSENIPEEAKITNLVKIINLRDEKDKWIDEITKSKNYKRKDYSREIINAGYNSIDSTKILEKIYCSK